MCRRRSDEGGLELDAVPVVLGDGDGEGHGDCGAEV